MFTNNYIKLQKARFLADNYQDYTTFTNIAGSSINGYIAYSFLSDLGYWMTQANCKAIVATETNTFAVGNIGYAGLYFGGGSTPASKSDYKLESPITSGLTITEPSSIAWADDGNGKYEAIASFNVRNTTDADINIYEIGLFTPVNNSAVSSTSKIHATSQTIYYVLMERTVLTEPITIPAGQAKVVTYKIAFNQTLNVE